MPSQYSETRFVLLPVTNFTLHLFFYFFVFILNLENLHFPNLLMSEFSDFVPMPLYSMCNCFLFFPTINNPFWYMVLTFQVPILIRLLLRTVAGWWSGVTCRIWRSLPSTELPFWCKVEFGLPLSLLCRCLAMIILGKILHRFTINYCRLPIFTSYTEYQ